MSSRSEILNAIRRQQLAPVEPPPRDGPWTTYTDPREQFVKMLEAVGGQCVLVSDESAIAESLCDVPSFESADRIYSSIAGVDESNVDLVPIDDPHELENLDFAILRGQFCVAENGAIWVTDEGLKHRATYFLVQHLALVVPSNRIVNNMHEAYAELAFSNREAVEMRFGTFISGPSKTADIEQSLVIGAHGARSLTVFLVSE
jgi:L-lactate dehydrogenase complex protein LldG